MHTKKTLRGINDLKNKIDKEMRNFVILKRINILHSEKNK
jgi:hypothetical protein